MARLTKPLTNTEVKNAKPKEKIYKLNDGFGLQLRIKPNGSKTWLLDYYKPHSNKRTSLSLGSYPEVSLACARTKRTEARELLAQDIDPKDYRDNKARQARQANSNTFNQIALNHHDVKKKSITEDYANDIWRSIEIHLIPKIGNIPIHMLDAPKVIEILRPISKTNPETVKRLCQRMNEVMVYAVNTGVIHHNPLAGIKKAFESAPVTHMPTIPPEELPQLMVAINRASIRLVTRYLIEWQLHTMTRPSEAAGARWEEIDFDKALWTIPAERMKKRKAHIVPLTDQMLALLEDIKPLTSFSAFVFMGDRDPKKPVNSSTVNVALKRMGYHGKLVAHGLRSLASTTLNEQGFDHDVIESCLAHADKDKVRAAYNRADYVERRKKVMSWWSDHIENAAKGNLSLATSKKGLSVVNG